ncbi:MAG: hypothetical protein IIX84_03030, partial [Oscillospiraceae bacterium]|nr:hypothetical protein [Oscillospiraceae bacterium]
MSKRKKKEAAARVSFLVVVAICLILFAIFGIWLIGRLSGDPSKDPNSDPNLGSEVTTSVQTGLTETLTSEEIIITVGKLLYEMQSNDIITLRYKDVGID